MLLSQARRLLITGGLSVQNDLNRYEEFDDAIQEIGNDFTEYVGGFEEGVGTVALGTTNTFNLDSVTDFRPERLIRLSINGDTVSLKHLDRNTVMRQIIANGTASGGTSGTTMPTMFAFNPGGTAGIIDHTGGTSGTVANLYYMKPFTSWTPGGTANGTIELNIPTRFAYQVFRFGASAVYQHPDPDERWINRGWAIYLAHRDFVRGEVATDRGVLQPDSTQYMGA